MWRSPVDALLLSSRHVEVEVQPLHLLVKRSRGEELVEVVGLAQVLDDVEHGLPLQQRQDSSGERLLEFIDRLELVEHELALRSFSVPLSPENHIEQTELQHLSSCLSAAIAAGLFFQEHGLLAVQARVRIRDRLSNLLIRSRVVRHVDDDVATRGAVPRLTRELTSAPSQNVSSLVHDVSAALIRDGNIPGFEIREVGLSNLDVPPVAELRRDICGIVGWEVVLVFLPLHRVLTRENTAEVARTSFALTEGEVRLSFLVSLVLPRLVIHLRVTVVRDQVNECEDELVGDANRLVSQVHCGATSARLWVVRIVTLRARLAEVALLPVDDDFPVVNAVLVERVLDRKRLPVWSDFDSVCGRVGVDVLCIHEYERGRLILRKSVRLVPVSSPSTALLLLRVRHCTATKGTHSHCFGSEEYFVCPRGDGLGTNGTADCINWCSTENG